MRKLLLIGAGRSSSFLIRYLLDHSGAENWLLTVADVSEDSALQKTGGHSNSKAIKIDINDEANRAAVISEADLVISMLPANMHFPVALECLHQRKHLITASYVSAEMKALHEEVKSSGLLFLNECGLDPGIDHMSAMKIIDEVKEKSGEIVSFKSYTGGLVAPESNDNPWGYKFSWNPRNVILAGQGTAKLIENGKYKYIPYSRLFSSSIPIEVESVRYDGYPNRDSLAYRKLYGIEKIQTMIRGTLRQLGYCNAWDVFVQLGMTDDTFLVENSEQLTYAQLVNSFLPEKLKGVDVISRLSVFLGISKDSPVFKLIEWTGVFSDEKIGIVSLTPAQILQRLLEKKWLLKETDKDLIVMQHLFEYTLNKKTIHHTSSLVVKGDDAVYTAMAKTVGLPAAIAAGLILNGKIKMRGVEIPVHKEIYIPILNELEKFGIIFNEKMTEQA